MKGVIVGVMMAAALLTWPLGTALAESNDAAATARPLHAKLINPAPAMAAYSDAGHLVVVQKAQAAQKRVTIARPLHARLIAQPTYAAFADATRLHAAKNITAKAGQAKLALSADVPNGGTQVQ